MYVLFERVIRVCCHIVQTAWKRRTAYNNTLTNTIILFLWRFSSRYFSSQLFYITCYYLFSFSFFFVRVEVNGDTNISSSLCTCVLLPPLLATASHNYVSPAYSNEHAYYSVVINLCNNAYIKHCHVFTVSLLVDCSGCMFGVCSGPTFTSYHSPISL